MDLAAYYHMNFTSHFKEHEDMVDWINHTYLILGYEIDNQIHPIHCFKYPPKDQLAISTQMS